MSVPVPQTVDILSLVVTHLAIDDAGRGALDPLGSAK
jgi:hypothetical protein